jgi:hypothetical protein
MPKLGGVMPLAWLAINSGSLSYDRTPEIRKGPEDCRVTHKLTQQTSRTLGLKPWGFLFLTKEK